MKEWARAFYQSKAWKECRKSYLISKQYLCEKCGEIAKVVHHRRHLTPQNITNPYIALAHDNLEALCQDCHNAVHHGRREPPRYTFDAAGNIVSPPDSRRTPPPANTDNA